MKTVWLRTGLALVLAITLTACQTAENPQSKAPLVVKPLVGPESDPATALAPASGVAESAAYLRTYTTNDTANKTLETNAALRLLSKFSDLWTPGTAYNNGTVVNSAVHQANIQYVSKVTAQRTAAEAEAAYLDDRRNQTYSVIDGLGPLAASFYTQSGLTTTITSVAADASTYAYDDKGLTYGSSDPAVTGAPLYPVVKLVKTIRDGSASTSSSKAYFNYARPWRWSDDGTMTEGAATDGPYYKAGSTTAFFFPTYISKVSVPASLKPIRGTSANSDGGFPSGHTNAGYLTALGLAYAIPERFQELLVRASDLGHHRILAGQHSPLDVMGARMLATAIVAANLSSQANAEVKTEAFRVAHTNLTTAAARDWTEGDWAANRQKYLERLTYGLSPIAAIGVAASVPLGAEVLLETRFPYLTADQRRQVLRTTALGSGYPLLDDAEGWGRLNLFAAADGYGALEGTVTVTMDATQAATSGNGFHAADTWRNSLGGTGRLVKSGTGTLSLTGANSYSGGTRVEGGVLRAAASGALGAGSVYVAGGTLELAGPTVVSGQLALAAQGTLKLAGGAKALVGGTSLLGGTLVVDLTASPVGGSSLVVVQAGAVSGSFASVSVRVNGADYTGSFTPAYSAQGLTLQF